MRKTHWKILIVDDDENDRHLLRYALVQFNGTIHISEAHDGQEAIDYLNAKGEFANRSLFPFPTFIFLDLKMPRVDGFSVLSHIKKNPQWAVIPSIVFSASADLDDIKKAFLCGACAYHVKPRTNDERRELCRKLIEYWGSSEIPETDDQGSTLTTDSHGKLGERIEQP
jgi:two-component system, response regulator